MKLSRWYLSYFLAAVSAVFVSLFISTKIIKRSRAQSEVPTMAAPPAKPDLSNSNGSPGADSDHKSGNPVDPNLPPPGAPGGPPVGSPPSSPTSETPPPSSPGLNSAVPPVSGAPGAAPGNSDLNSGNGATGTTGGPAGSKLDSKIGADAKNSVLDGKNSKAGKPKAEATSAVDGIAALSDDFKYDPTAGRDPFRPFRKIVIGSTPSIRKGGVTTTGGELLEPLQLVDLDKLSVVGILWDVKNPRAMLAEKGAGKVYTVGLNAKIGRRNGIVRLIREGEVVVIESEEIDGNTIKSTKILEIKR